MEPNAQASSVAWNWRDRAAGSAAARAREAAANRRKGLIGGAVGLAFAALLHFGVHKERSAMVDRRHRRPGRPARPRLAARPLQGPRRAGSTSSPTPWAPAVTWVLMTVLFYLVFLPAGLILRARGKLGITQAAPTSACPPTGSRPTSASGRGLSSPTASSSEHEAPRHLLLLPRLGRLPGRRRADRRRGPGGALHPQEARRGLPRQRRALLPARGGASRPGDLDYVVFYDKPLLKFDRLLETYLAVAPRGSARPCWRCRSGCARSCASRRASSEALERAASATPKRDLLHRPPRVARGASAFFPSPFEEAAILTLDGVGEWATTTLRRRRGATASS